MPVQVLPSGRCTHVARIVTADGDLAHAVAGQAVTLALSDEIDVSRGDVLAAAATASVSDRLVTQLVAIGTEPLVPGRRYLLKLAAATVSVRLEPDLWVIDLDTHDYCAAPHLAVNDIGRAVITVDRPIAADHYADCRETGSFILIDRESCDTVGMGIIETLGAALKRKRSSFSDLIHAAETHARSVAKAISWRATGSLDTFIIAALVTGSSTLAGGVALAEVLTKTVLYYAHERVWALIPWGRR
jgi:sulfate adenylyltransferase subunit 1 (EFTu-like GTPase family)/uncharacterized membrane protein